MSNLNNDVSAEFVPLLIDNIKVGDVLTWVSSSSGTGFRDGVVHVNSHGWLLVGDLRTPRQQSWLDNPFIRVHLAEFEQWRKESR